MKSDFETFLETFPPSQRDTVRDVWSALPSDLRREFELTISAFAGIIRKNPASVSDLLKMISRTAGPAVAPLHKLAIVGPVNAGKSTLFNALTPESECPAAVSAVPGTTKVSQVQRTEVFSLVDTPGADRAHDEGNSERDDALKSAQESDFLIICFDATRSVTKSDLALFAELQYLGRPYIVVLNKIDRIERPERARVIEVASKALGLTTERIIALSASEKIGLDRLVLEVAALEPRLLGELGTLLPSFRKKLCWQAVRRAAVASALIAITPIPLMDVIPLMGVQTSLVLTIARIYGKPLNFKRAREILTGLGAGLIARMAFAELSKLGSVPGLVLSASIATGATLSIGALVIEMFDTGRRPEKGRALKLASQFTQRITLRLKQLVGRKPSKKHVTQVLEGLLDDDFAAELTADGEDKNTLEAESRDKD